MEFNASWLKEHLDVPFDVLGYWYELMKIAKDVPARDWMKVYANLLTLKCKSMSLREFQEKRKGFGSFCVFLDEFSTEPWSVFTQIWPELQASHALSLIPILKSSILLIFFHLESLLPLFGPMCLLG